MWFVNTTTVKYIHPRVPPDGSFHNLTDYELATREVDHRTYTELYDQVRAWCPKGYACIEPIALFHEVTWTTNGEHNVLHHAIEEYGDLWSTGAGPKTICVDVEGLGVQPAIQSITDAVEELWM